jgi:hypothetical protein
MAKMNDMLNLILNIISIVSACGCGSHEYKIKSLMMVLKKQSGQNPPPGKASPGQFDCSSRPGTPLPDEAPGSAAPLGSTAGGGNGGTWEANRQVFEEFDQENEKVCTGARGCVNR